MPCLHALFVPRGTEAYRDLLISLVSSEEQLRRSCLAQTSHNYGDTKMYNEQGVVVKYLIMRGLASLRVVMS